MDQEAGKTALDALIGNTIAEVRADEKTRPEHIEFLCASGDRIQYYAEGDCCSLSWIEHISGLDALIGAEVALVKEHASEDATPDGDDGKVDVYKWTIETNKGRCDIEMRNESNGYYSGWLEQQTGAPLPHVIGEDF